MEMHPDNLDALCELINIGVGHAAKSLNEVLRSHIVLSNPDIQFSTLQNIKNILGIGDDTTLSCVSLSFHGIFEGTSVLVFPPEEALNLVTLALQEDACSEEIDAMQASTLQEIGNIVINSIMGRLSNILHESLTFDLPVYLQSTLENVIHPNVIRSEPAILVVKTCFHVQRRNIEGRILLLFEVESFDKLLGMVGKLYD